MVIDDENKRLDLVWHYVYDLDVKTGEWAPIQGQLHRAKDAVVEGVRIKQEADFANGGLIVTRVSGNDSTVTFDNVQGCGKPQWVSFYYQNTDDMGFGDQPVGSLDRIGGSWILRQIGSVMMNGDTASTKELRQRDTHKSIILSTPLLLELKEGSNATTVGGLWNGNGTMGGDIERIVVYPPEE